MSTKISILHDRCYNEYQVFSAASVKKWAKFGLKRINRAVGFRLVTKAGARGVVNLVKIVPLVGGVVGGALDAAATKVIGQTAKQVFVPIPAKPTGV